MTQAELRYGAFRRVFQLPEGVGPDQVEAESDKGLLRLRVGNTAYLDHGWAEGG